MRGVGRGERTEKAEGDVSRGEVDEQRGEDCWGRDVVECGEEVELFKS